MGIKIRGYDSMKNNLIYMNDLEGNMVKRNTLGRFVKGCGLPQTPEGWIDRYVTLSERKLIGKIGLKPITDKRVKERRLQNPIKHKKILKQKREEYQRNKTRYEKSRKEYRQKYPEKTQYQNKKYWKKHREWLIENQYDYYWNRGGREIQKEYNRLHPKSGGGSDSIECILAMNMARSRDNNMCKWGGCTKKCDEVNHIFPRSTHPYLEAELWNLISYCFDHHIKWHEYKGDVGAVVLIKSNRAKKEVV